MDEYIAICDEGSALQPCVKLRANNVDEAKNKFCNYLKTKGINDTQDKKLYFIPLAYVRTLDD